MVCLACGCKMTSDLFRCPECEVEVGALLRDVLDRGSLLRQGTYKIEHAIGRGGFGITYVALHQELGQQVAIKEFYPTEIAVRGEDTTALSVSATKRELFEKCLEQFLEEGRLLAKLDSPLVVRVRDFFRERGTAYLVMDFVPGRDLRSELRENPLHDQRLSELTECLVEALAAIHEAGICHLDVKPENVLISEGGQPVLVDFGASRQGFGPKRSLQPVTLAYGAPEFFTGANLGPKTDIFALGMMLYEMVTGAVAPSALARLSDAYKDWEPRLRPPWGGLISSAIALEPDRRPDNIRDWWSGREATPLEPARSQTDSRVTQLFPEDVDTDLLVGKSLPGLQVNPDGSGDFRSLEEALRERADQTVIRLSAGRHQLSGGLNLEGDLEVVGEGWEKTEVVFEGNDCLLDYGGIGLLKLRDLSLVCEGALPVDVVRCRGGQFEFQSCCFKGGRVDAEGHYGRGLVAQGESRGLLIECHLVGNGVHGTEVRERAEVRLERNVFRGNRGAGLAYSGSGSGLAVHNRSLENRWGVLVWEHARPELESNLCQENGVNGMTFRGHAEGIARGNVCDQNGEDGICVQDSASTALANNRCRSNAWSGMTLLGQNSVQVLGNDCSANGQEGIFVGDSASPKLEQNTCGGNRNHGIACFGEASAYIVGNTCAGNGASGIWVAQKARPLVEGNICRDNRRSGIGCTEAAEAQLGSNQCLGNVEGILLAGSARAKVQQNFCAGNHQGISIAGDFQGELAQNTCLGNQEAGILVAGRSCPRLDGNRCCESPEGSDLPVQKVGIQVVDEAQPGLRDNFCVEQAVAGIAFAAAAGGWAQNNQCHRNQRAGVLVGDRARPLLEANNCSQNRSAGLSVGDQAEPVLKGNIFESNGEGVEIRGQAQPELENNRCEHNARHGISYYEESSGTARLNTCKRNGGHGILVGGRLGVNFDDEQQGVAAPCLEANTCALNQMSGIAFTDGSKGQARSNTCMENQSHGIFVEKGARPKLSRNVCEKNGKGDTWISRILRNR